MGPRPACEHQSPSQGSDTGFTADGEFIGGVLHHGGMLFCREEQVERPP
ncbi:Atu4866 domain-containing protein [Microvirga makkahensis]|nr:Atu4866 domain-containing protein [Microvirga makkahensis]